MERVSREVMDPNLRHKPRLISIDELPPWLLRDEEEVEQMTCEADQERLFGRGSRSRKTVDYSETLTEKEWLRGVEDGNLEEIEEAKKKRRRRKRPDTPGGDDGGKVGGVR